MSNNSFLSLSQVYKKTVKSWKLILFFCALGIAVGLLTAFLTRTYSSRSHVETDIPAFAEKNIQKRIYALQFKLFGHFAACQLFSKEFFAQLKDQKEYEYFQKHLGNEKQFAKYLKRKLGAYSRGGKKFYALVANLPFSVHFVPPNQWAIQTRFSDKGKHKNVAKAAIVALDKTINYVNEYNRSLVIKSQKENFEYVQGAELNVRKYIARERGVLRDAIKNIVVDTEIRWADIVTDEFKGKIPDSLLQIYNAVYLKVLNCSNEQLENCGEKLNTLDDVLFNYKIALQMERTLHSTLSSYIEKYYSNLRYEVIGVPTLASKGISFENSFIDQPKPELVFSAVLGGLFGLFVAGFFILIQFHFNWINSSEN